MHMYVFIVIYALQLFWSIKPFTIVYEIYYLPSCIRKIRDLVNLIQPENEFAFHQISPRIIAAT